MGFRTINLNTQENIIFILFPDNQPHVNITGVMESEEVDVICSITSSQKLLQLLECSNALDNLFAKKDRLYIPYLMGARFDRKIQEGDSVDLKIIADMINYCEFKKVYLYDVHSDVATMAIKNSVNREPRELIQEYCGLGAVLICPDAGASKKIDKYLKLNPFFKDIVYCNKTRDLKTGGIKLQVLEPEKCANRNCVIIDDLCDGGGTFIAIAQQIKPSHLTLIVSHGIFSKGFSTLEEYFDEIIVSDSYCHEYNSTIVKTIPHPFH